MAGRPATARRPGLTGTHYLSIALAIITVAALVGFVLQLTRVNEADQRADRAERRLAQYGTPPGPIIGRYYQDEASSQKTTVFQVMTNDLDRMATLMAGTTGMTGATLESRANQLLKQIATSTKGAVGETDTLLTALGKLEGALNKERQKSAQLSGDLAAKVREVESRTNELKASRDQFEQQVAELRADVEQAVADFTRKLNEKDTQLGELTSNLEQRDQELLQCGRECDRRAREMQIVIDRQTRQVANLQSDIQGLKRSFDREEILTKADGRVARAIPGSGIVYINLGANDNVLPGMTFSIFSQGGVPDEALIGKASIDVATVMENTSECRVTRQEPNRPIIEGDLVVSIAYERNRRPKFVVDGQFDLDFDGHADSDGIERITDIIRQWGGQVVPSLDETVDFVVIGTAPDVPVLPPDATLIDRDQAERRLLDKAEFEELKAAAEAMYIPIITQNQFLFLTGYHENMALRGG